VIRNNASRAAAAHRERQPRAPPRAQQESDKEVTTAVHTVVAVFGEGASGSPEVWLGVQVKTTASNVKVQFLEFASDAEHSLTPVYELSDSSENYAPNMIEHSFPDVPFEVTTTYKLNKNGSRSKSAGSDVVLNINLRSYHCLDAGILDQLKLSCGAT
jgi:hypothetical protein